MLDIHSGVMYALMGITYLSFLLVIFEYVRLLVIDPSDHRLSDKNHRSD
jgi:hypothetical protein